MDFYPSITEKLLKKCFKFAKDYAHLSDDDQNIILHACKSVLFDQNGAWVKKNSEGLFDIGMGSYHGAEVCELVGLFLLSKITALFGAGKVGLYRDDGLAVIHDPSDQSTDNLRKKLFKIFKQESLDITVETNLKIADFLDVTLNLSTGKFYPYRKPNDTPLYVNKQSNHPPTIIKQLPLMVNKRISDISFDEEEFEKSKPMYQKALNDSGFKHQLKYIPPGVTRYKNRPRKVIWFNPPFCKSVKTNIARHFLRLLDKHFPPHHKLHRLFNRNNVKVSYSCLDNVASKISQHNKTTLNPPPERVEKRLCNCRKADKPNCPLQGECLLSSIVYKATVRSERETKQYIGLCETTFKQRLYNHRSAWNAVKKSKKTLSSELPKYVWHLKNKNVPHNITWEVAARARPYECSNLRCYLCLTEKMLLAEGDKNTLLNKRSEIVSKCRHRNKFTLRELK